MGDEVRRSGRATKGQHTKNIETVEATPSKRGGKGSRSKSTKQEATPPEEDADAIIRCICGYVEEDEDDERKMVICDSCEAWQHNECMEISENDDELPDQYFCEECRPEDHQELLAKVARGEKPWEERARQREIEEEERKARRRKGGKKSKKGRASDIKAQNAKAIDMPSSSPPSKNSATPIAKSSTTPAAKSGAPAVQPAITPAAKPTTAPATEPATTPAANVAITPVAISAATTVTKPGATVTKPGATVTTKPATSPDDKVVGTTIIATPIVPPTVSPAVSQHPLSSAVEPPMEKRSVNSHKRKLSVEAESGSKDVDQQEPSNKVRKLSSPIEVKSSSPKQRRKSTVVASSSKRETKGIVLQTELVENISELKSDGRRRVAGALVKLFVDQTQQAQKQGTFKLPHGQTPDAFGLKLGLQVEYAVYLNFWGTAEEPSSQYSEKFRTISHNVKANSSLRDRLLNGSLAPNDLSKMSSNDMKSQELQDMTAEMMKKSEKQHVIIQEEGPRIRRTHKGEEIVGDDSHPASGADQIYSQPIIRRRDTDDLTSMRQASESSAPHSPTMVELPENIGFTGTAGSPTTTTQPLAVDTKAVPRPSMAGDRKSSATFNIQDVWSSVSGPDGENLRIRQPPNPTESVAPQAHPPQGPPVEADADIDHLLKDDEPDEEEPYSPTDYTADPGAVVWRGKMSMVGVAEFTGVAKHVAGANLSATFPWSQLIPSALAIEGRIDIERASEYLCGLRFSHTTDVSVVAVTPTEDPESRSQFEKLFKYFTERKRYGVIGKSPVAAVKDTYLVPLEAGMSKKPDFIELLQYCAIEDPCPERMLVLTFVIKSTNSPSDQATPRQMDTAVIASPIGNQTSAFQTPVPQGHPASHASPPPPYPGAFAGSPAQPQHGFVSPANPQPYPYPGPTGMEAARQALGDLANAPSVGQLLAEAPNTGVPEFRVIKDLLEGVPATRSDFVMLKGMLTVKHQQGGG